MTPPRQTLNGASAPRPTDPGEGFDEAASAVLATSQQGAAAGDGEHRGSHTVTAAAKMTGDRTPPAMGTTTMSLTDRNLRTSGDELPQVRSRRRWVLPAAGAVLLLAGCTVAGVNLLGDKNDPAPTPPSAAAGPSAAEIQTAKDAAWKSVQAYNERTLQAQRVNSLDGIDLATVALPSAINAQQQWIDDAIAAGTRTDGASRVELISSEYNQAAPDAFAPARVQIATCYDTSDVRFLDQAGNNVRVGPDGSTTYATRLIVNFWVYDEDGAWKVDGGQRTETPC